MKFLRNKRAISGVLVLVGLLVVGCFATLGYAISKIDTGDSDDGDDGGTTIILPGEDYPPAGFKLQTKDKYNTILTDTIEWAVFKAGTTNLLQAYRNGDYIVCCASGTADSPDGSGLISLGTWGVFKAAAVDRGEYSERGSYTLWWKRDSTYESGTVNFSIDWEKYDQDTTYQIVRSTRNSLGTITLSVAAATTESGGVYTTTAKTKSDVKGRVIMIATGANASQAYDTFDINGAEHNWTYDGTNYYHVFGSLSPDITWIIKNTGIASGTIDIDLKLYREDEYGRCDGHNHDSAVVQTIDCLKT